ncbi:hypothetical protein TRVA0_002S01288 [Trichomonascus vanleenenianus]|uniref:Mcp1p n=1 Tax=Trichomonascus vanleenenianus TaxID=2268995 RepID=UPI003ECA0A2B
MAKKDDILTPVSPAPLPEDEKAPLMPVPALPKKDLLWWANTIQRYSSYSFLSFMTLHASSVIVAPLISIEAGDSTMRFANALYQEQLIEPVIVYGAIGLHVASGGYILWRKIKADYLARDEFPSMRRIINKLLSPTAKSGHMLATLVIPHVLVNRIGPQTILGDSSSISLAYIARAFQRSPWLSWTFYLLFVGFASHHIIWGLRKWLNAYGKRSRNVIYTAFFATVTASIVSLVKISRMPPASGWFLKQYDQVLEFFWH